MEVILIFNNLTDEEKLADCIARDCYIDKDGIICIGGSDDCEYRDNEGQGMFFDDEKFLKKLPLQKEL